MMTFSSRVNSLKASSVMEISAQAQALKAKGFDVISLAAGEPDFNTPVEIQQAATEAMAKGITKYTPASGFLALRELIADKVTRENGFNVEPDEVVITSGAKHAIYLTLQCLLDSGDRVLVPTPAWVSYAPMIELTGASFVPLPLSEEDGFSINVERWKGMVIPPNVKGIILNSPSNPTGTVYSREELIRLVGWAMQRNLWILSDEIYEKILYDGHTHTSVASLGPEVKNGSITISGFSKSHCMTGWRLGWAIGNRELIKKISDLQSQSNTHVTSFVQSAGMVAAKLPSQIVDNMVQAFKRRRDYCMKRLQLIKDHVGYVEPKGAFYIFINLTKWLTPRKMNDVDFCKELLMKQYIGLVPGTYFGKEKYVRLSYATSEENLKKAFDGLEKFLSQSEGG